MKKILLISCLDPLELKMRLTSDDHWFIRALGINKKRIETYFALKKLPKIADLNKYEKIIIGGSLHSTFEKKFWITKLKKIILYAYKKQIPTFGVCFGHQLIAEALGGQVKTRLTNSENGDITVMQTKEGKNSLLFNGVPKRFKTFGSHDDMIVKLPKIPNIKILAYNKLVSYQALDYGHNFYSTQFHIEFTPEIMHKINSYFLKLNKKYPACKHPKKIIRNFLKISRK